MRNQEKMRLFQRIVNAGTFLALLIPVYLGGYYLLSKIFNI